MNTKKLVYNEKKRDKLDLANKTDFGHHYVNFSEFVEVKKFIDTLPMWLVSIKVRRLKNLWTVDRKTVAIHMYKSGNLSPSRLDMWIDIISDKVKEHATSNKSLQELIPVLNELYDFQAWFRKQIFCTHVTLNHNITIFLTGDAESVNKRSNRTSHNPSLKLLLHKEELFRLAVLQRRVFRKHVQEKYLPALTAFNKKYESLRALKGI